MDRETEAQRDQIGPRRLVKEEPLNPTSDNLRNLSSG